MSEQTIFPITESEAHKLHVLGWSSGYGWANEYDWFHEPSAGPAIFVKDDPEWMTKFLADLEHIRRTEAANARLDRLYDTAEKLLEAAKNFVEWAENPAEGAVGMLNEQDWLRRAKEAITRVEGK